jgi:hypothetical protein
MGEHGNTCSVRLRGDVAEIDGEIVNGATDRQLACRSPARAA